MGAKCWNYNNQCIPISSNSRKIFSTLSSNAAMFEAIMAQAGVVVGDGIPVLWARPGDETVLRDSFQIGFIPKPGHGDD